MVVIRLAVATAIFSALTAFPAQAASRTSIPGVNLTPVSLCVAATLRFVSTNRTKLSLPKERYCTDGDWEIEKLEHDGKNLYWSVPFDDKDRKDAAVFCSCRKR
jgi:hypothetical protein